MRGKRQTSEKSEIWGIGKILLLLVIAFTTTISASTWQTVSAIESADERRNQLAVTAMLNLEKERVERFAAAQNDWDDEILEEEPSTKEEERQHPDASRADLPTIITEAEGNFDEIWVTDRHGNALVVIEPESANHLLYQRNSPAAVKNHIAKLTTEKLRGSTFIRQGNGIGIFAVTPVEDSSEFAKTIIGAKGGFLLIQENVTQEFLAEMSQMLQLPNLSNGSHRGGRNMVEITAKDGSRAGALRWTAAKSTFAVVISKLPLVILLALAFLLLAYFMIRKAQTSFRYLNRQARVDWLSKLPNRWALQRHIRGRIAEGLDVSLALIDLDAFKSINDFHGHIVGDNVIRYVARQLEQLCPNEGLVARLGGDEFAMVAQGKGGHHDLTNAIDRLLEKLAEPIEIDGHSMILGASVGIVRNEDNLHRGELLRRADIAMYAAKQSGRMCAMHYVPSMETVSLAMINMKDKLISAMNSGEIGLKYQPIICSRSGEIVAVESLARWFSPEDGNISAEAFIPVAEQFGLIGTIGQRLLAQACRELAHSPKVRLAVNVSAAQIARPDFIATVRAALAAAKMSPKQLELEITETSLVNDGSRARRSLEELSALGIRITLDDFGAGYASIGFLRQFRFDAMKIDRTIVSDCIENAASRGMLQACIAMASALEMEVIAEGVETEEQADMMRAAGCQLLQGWHFSRALPLNEILPLIQTRQLPQQQRQARS